MMTENEYRKALTELSQEELVDHIIKFRGMILKHRDRYTDLFNRLQPLRPTQKKALQVWLDEQPPIEITAVGS